MTIHLVFDTMALVSNEELRLILQQERQHYEAALEQALTHHVGALADGQKAMADDIGGMKVHLKSLDSRMERVEERVGKIEHHLGLNGVSKPTKRPTKKSPKGRK